MILKSPENTIWNTVGTLVYLLYVAVVGQKYIVIMWLGDYNEIFVNILFCIQCIRLKSSWILENLFLDPVKDEFCSSLSNPGGNA